MRGFVDLPDIDALELARSRLEVLDDRLRAAGTPLNGFMLLFGTTLSGLAMKRPGSARPT